MLTRPDFVTEAAGQEAIELAESVGLYLDPWQQMFVRVAMAERGNGLWAASEVGKLVARQNGKGAALEAIFLHGLFLDERMKLQLWTAHQFKTSSEAFLRIRGLIDGSDDLRRLVKRVTTANGDEGIELRDGSRLRFLARSKSSGRGFSPQRLGLDEAQELSDASLEAIVPALSAQSSKHILYAGTVPGPETNNPEVFTRVRDRGRAGSPRLAWLEWTPKGSDDPTFAVDLDSPEAWAESNPALGYRLTAESIESERGVMSVEGFARERLSIWPDLGPGGSWVIPAAVWSGLAESRTVPMTGYPVFALEMTEDQSTVAVVSAGLTKSERTRVEVAYYGTSVGVVDELARMVLEHEPLMVIVDPKAPAGSLIPLIRKAGINLTTVSAQEFAQACGGILNAATEGKLSHLGDSLLTDAVRVAKRRNLSDAWAWDRLKSPDITCLVAATLAAWGISQSIDATAW